MNNSYQDSIEIFYSLRKEGSELDYMIVEHATYEQLLAKFYTIIFLRCKQRYAVDYMVDEHTTNECFKQPRFSSNILHALRQRFEVDYMVDEHITNE